MDVKSSIFSLLVLLSIISSTANNTAINPELLSSFVFPLQGNAYPHGGYSVSLNIGNRHNIFHLQIDTGSDLTWVQCGCKSCTQPGVKLYKPHGNFVKCADPMCTTQLCTGDMCLVEIYKSVGVIVRDLIYPTSPQVSLLPEVFPEVAFGCGFEDKGGVLGLGKGNISILSQLHSQGLIRNVMGHCLSSQGGGFLFFGDEFISSPSPSPGRFVWTVQSSSGKYYSTGPADLLFNRKPTSVKGLQLSFDCGTTYTYFNSQVYQVVLDLVNNDLQGKPLSRATEDPLLPICWKGVKPFKSLSDVNSYFKPLALSFTKSKNSQLLLPPAAYLIIRDRGNVCLGILNGTAIGLGNLNIIGGISLHDKMVIYDNENQQIGWAPANCDLPSN